MCRFFWRFHKIHHSQEDLFWIGVRDHPSYALQRVFFTSFVAHLNVTSRTWSTDSRGGRTRS